MAVLKTKALYINYYIQKDIKDWSGLIGIVKMSADQHNGDRKNI